jgi:transmembrane sensor
VDVSANQRNPVRVQAADWVLRLDAAPADGDLRKEFDRWLEQSEAHRTEYLKVRHTWSRLGKIPRDMPIDRAADNVVRLSERKPRRVRWIAAGAALAAACLALVLFPVIQRHVLADYVTGVAELREVVLPDGSAAWLDAGSAIAVDYRADNRAVTLLAGRAFFEVVKDSGRPFTVRADEASVVVTGTAFDVRKAPDAISVTVQSGSVDVALAGLAESNRLTGGQGLVYDRQTRSVSLREVAPLQVASWRSRRLVVYDTMFGDVLEELGRHMPGAIVVRDGSLNRQMVSGVFDLSRPLEALEGLAGSQRATLTRITPYLVIVNPP